ncbi:MAG TPA: hypothetical protein VJR89_35005 [Polyangiales bacterium]|nr:hypothetical protein [Polyangiales bacterium]
MRRSNYLLSRALHASEVDFLRRYFGASLNLEPIRVSVSWGKRSWSPFGQRISLAVRHFRDSEPLDVIDLDDAHSAAVFAHEAMHVWQRQQGRAVTREAIPLQAGYILKRFDPYHYEPSSDPQHMLAKFESANVEQQAKIFEDYVFAERRGQCIEPFAEVVKRVQAASARHT